MDEKKFANIPVRLVSKTKDGQKVKLAVCINGSFYNCILSFGRAFALANAIVAQLPHECPLTLDEALDLGVIQSVQNHDKN